MPDEDKALMIKLIEGQTRLETKMDSILSNHDDHESRLRELEKAKYRIAGLFAAIGSGAGAGGGWLLSLIS